MPKLKREWNFGQEKLNLYQLHVEFFVQRSHFDHEYRDKKFYE